ncbi:metallothionein [Pseudanabaena sp. FACHB-2040]|uniref:metallothionein n=1 Tax=Pseudanabaena sp. FACHB-2040 TaxID=2692859 RepID=UPI00168805CC|nr:metallothionein [Pseudanabaena sp. FACHB-2040]MBD0269813.1 metallothionein [Cyanobacteria bacterium Co-bin8]MBD2258169.1 metallothionein [Pseudanabaena sp. FACHB-2040]
MTTVTQMKCACSSCLCVMDVGTAIEKDGQYYCSEACSTNHESGAGCGHHGCSCHS